MDMNVPKPRGAVLDKSDWIAADLSRVWCQLESQLTPFNQIINIRGELFRQMDEGAKLFFASLLMQETEDDVMFCRDGTGHDRYFLGNPRHFYAIDSLVMEVSGSEPFWFPRVQAMNMAELTVTEPITTEAKKRKDKKIPRPPNPFILYRKDHHTVVKEANPGITNNEISQILGAAWQDESREVREKYKQMSLDIKVALLEAHPDYKYAPRRPSEKRRRARKTTQKQVDAAASPKVTDMA